MGTHNICSGEEIKKNICRDTSLIWICLNICGIYGTHSRMKLEVNVIFQICLYIGNLIIF